MCLLAGALAACDPAPEPEMDAGGDAATVTCSRASDCDDGRFCNGAETCSPGEPSAGPDGCAPGVPPCDGECDEASDSCRGCDPNEADVDGDGFDSVACGGDDCDDEDPERFPGNTEVCDAAHKDEDCNPATIAGVVDGDDDVDGFISATCCNPVDGGLRCGPDCDDTRADVRPGVAERCSAEDVDDDCDGEVNEGCDCQSGVDTRTCAEAGALGACGLATQTCVSGTWPDDCPTSTGDELCEGAVDEDCDGEIDEGFGQCCEGDTRACDNGCPTSASAVEVCTSAGTWGPCGAPEQCNYCDDDGDGSLDDDAALASVTLSEVLQNHGTGYGPGTSNIDDDGVLVVPLLPDNATGAYALDHTSRIRLGYGVLSVEATATVSCFTAPAANGWAAWVLAANDASVAAESPLASSGDVGQPTNRDGYAAVRDYATNPSDRVSLEALRRGAAEREFGFNNSRNDDVDLGCDQTDAPRVQRLRLEIQPDDPSSANDELEVCAYEVGELTPIACCQEFGNGPDECPTRLQVGDFVIVGVSGREDGPGQHAARVFATYEQSMRCVGL